MKTKKILLVALLAISTAIFTGACLKGKSADKKDNESSHTITMNNSTFTPASLTIAAGSTVTWMNDDNVIHAVTTADNSINTGDIAPGVSYSVTFNTARTFNYYDAHNTNMIGELIVTSAGSK